MLPAKRGCSVAMTVVGSAALALSLSWTMYFLPRWKMILASNVALEIERRTESYHRRFGRWPAGSNTDILLALRGLNPGQIVFLRDDDGFPVKANAFVDQWDSPFVFRIEADGRPRPVSPGPNRKPGDADDIDSAAARAKAEELSHGPIPPWEPESVSPPPPAPPAEATPAPATP